jgi:hypothetical protein
MTRTAFWVVFGLLTVHALLPTADVRAFQCGAVPSCGAQPVCDAPIVPLPPCCEASPLFPPAPPLVAPVIVGVPVDQYCPPVTKVPSNIGPQTMRNR